MTCFSVVEMKIYRERLREKGRERERERERGGRERGREREMSDQTRLSDTCFMDSHVFDKLYFDCDSSIFDESVTQQCE